jgi:uncharacterized protein
MTDTKNLSPEILLHIAETLNVPMHGLVAVIELLNEGGTVPFIARYRKEATGNLDEVQILAIEEKLAYFRELEDRRETILASIAEQGKLTDELKARIEATLDKSELEDLYLPYKPKRRTKATIAREKGLEPLAKYMWEQQKTDQPLEIFAASFVNAELGVGTVEEALEGARHIVSEWISEDADLRKALRKLVFDEGTVVSKKVADAVDEQDKFKMYYEYSEPVKTIPSHRMLAIRRGEGEKVLYFLIEVDAERAVGIIQRHVLKVAGDWTRQLDLAIEDAWKRLLNSSIQGEIRLELKRSSDTEAIKVFRDNLYNLLLAPPAGPISVLGIDPGLRTGCKVAVVDETGKLLAHDVFYLHTSKHGNEEATPKLEAMLRKYNVRAIAIGNGTAGRETDAFVRDFLRDKGLCKRGRGQRVLGFRGGAAGVSRSRPDGAWRHLDCAAAAGPAVRTGEGGSEIDWGGAVPARRGPAPVAGFAGDGDRELREQGGRGPEHFVVDAAAFCGRNYGAHRAEYRDLPQRKGEFPVAYASAGSAGDWAEDL